MKPLSITVLALSLSVSMALTGCGSDDSDSSESSASSSPSQTSSPSDPSTPSDEAPQFGTTDATAVCGEVAVEIGTLTQQALENVGDEAKSAEVYNQIADAYEASAEKLDDQEAKGAFQALADINRDMAENGLASVDTDALNQANEDFGKVCFGS